MTDPAPTRIIPTLGDRLMSLLPSEAPFRWLDAEDSALSFGGRFHVSVAEIYLRLSRDQMRERDFLCVFAMILEGDAGARELDSLNILSPESLRSHATAIPTGIIIGDVHVGPISERITQMGAVLYSLPRMRGVSRIVEAIQSLTTAARYARDAEGANALLAGVVDRLELLAQSPGVSTIFAGVHRLIGSAGVHYALLGAGRTDGAFGDSIGRDEAAYHVKDRRLCIGRSRDAASPWRGGEFLLLSIGAARTGADPNRIDQLRRQHTLVQSGAAHYESKAALETYQTKVERLRLANRLASIYGPRGAYRAPVTTPVSISIAPNIEDVALLRGEISPDFASKISMMRDGLKYELGCEFPGVRVSTSPDESYGTYTISIEETPVVSGALRLDQSLCNATVAQLSLQGIEAEPATNPANGNESAWVKLDQAEALETAGFTTWTPDGYLVLHLSSVLRKNATVFVGIQAVAALIRQYARYDDILAAPGGLPRFTDVIRGMLEDEVPIHEIKAICDRYLEVTELPTHEILEEIRALPVVNANLFWNKEDVPIYRLGKKFIEMMERGIICQGEAAVLALEPEPTQQALTVVRNEVSALPPTAKNPVIFCEDWRIRPFVRKLVELEFPHLRVVSRRESTNADARPVIGTIELED